MAIEQVAGPALAILTGVAIGAWLPRDRPSLRAVQRGLTTLTTHVDRWQRSQDVHQDELDRRLARVEEAAARAENETRMLAGLLSDKTRQAALLNERGGRRAQRRL